MHRFMMINRMVMCRTVMARVMRYRMMRPRRWEVMVLRHSDTGQR